MSTRPVRRSQPLARASPSSTPSCAAIHGRERPSRSRPVRSGRTGPRGRTGPCLDGSPVGYIDAERITCPTRRHTRATSAIAICNSRKDRRRPPRYTATQLERDLTGIPSICTCAGLTRPAISDSRHDERLTTRGHGGQFVRCSGRNGTACTQPSSRTTARTEGQTS